MLKRFSQVKSTQRETAVVITVSLVFILILVGSRVVPNVIENELYRQPMFYVGSVILGLIGFFALELLGSISFLGGGAMVAAIVFIGLLAAGAWSGDTRAQRRNRYHPYQLWREHAR